MLSAWPPTDRHQTTSVRQCHEIPPLCLTCYTKILFYFIFSPAASALSEKPLLLHKDHYYSFLSALFTLHESRKRLAHLCPMCMYRTNPSGQSILVILEDAPAALKPPASPFHPKAYPVGQMPIPTPGSPSTEASERQVIASDWVSFIPRSCPVGSGHSQIIQVSPGVQGPAGF